jgi:hypothetical protein
MSASFRPARRAKAIISGMLFIFTVALLGAQAAAQAPQGAMSGPAPAAAAQNQPALEETIVSVEGSTLVLAGKDGTSRVLVPADALILRRVTATLASIQPGEAVGVAADRNPDGSLTATVINIFPAALWQRARKGQFPMASGQVMTNAEVDRVVNKVDGDTLYLKYEMLTAAIAVPPSAEIRRSESLKLADLKPGMKVMLRLAPSTDGTLRAASLSLEAPAS